MVGTSVPVPGIRSFDHWHPVPRHLVHTVVTDNTFMTPGQPWLPPLSTPGQTRPMGGIPEFG